jgi:hypothetical protein
MLGSIVGGQEGLAGSGFGFDELPQAYQVHSDWKTPGYWRKICCKNTISCTPYSGDISGSALHVMLDMTMVCYG